MSTHSNDNNGTNTHAFDVYEKAASVIARSKHLVAFTGAGISVESGVPPFRGPTGLWSRYDPKTLDIDYFYANPADSWRVIREIFYEKFLEAKPNPAHQVLASWEEQGLLKALITQNIDDLHYRAGNTHPIEYHGNSRMLVCTTSGKRYEAIEELLKTIPPYSAEGGLLKPDFVFFGEPIPAEAASRAEQASQQADVMLVIGTTGEIYPASLLPQVAARNGATIIEINPEPTNYTHGITDLFLQDTAVTAMIRINELIS